MSKYTKKIVPMKNKYPVFGYATKRFNPLTGCTKGCGYCWARGMAYRLKGRAGYPADNPFRPTFHADRLREPEMWRNPQVVACNFMGDWMDSAFTLDQQLQIIHTAQNNERHNFLTLTKQPRNLVRHFHWFGNRYSLQNMWHGLSITNQQDADEKLPIFLQIPGKKWLSIEPMVGQIDLAKIKPTNEPFKTLNALTGKGFNDLAFKHSEPNMQTGSISQVILGGMTGPKAVPLHPEWVRKVRDDCKAAGTPFMFKQFGEWAPFWAIKDEAPKEWGVLDINGNYFSQTIAWNGKTGKDSELGEVYVYKVGKKDAGRVMDGREHTDLAWGQLPEVEDGE